MTEFGDERIGSVVAEKYRLERLLGQGGMGAVYLATHVGVGRSFAVKLLKPEAADGEGGRERFLREARVAAAVGHPGIVDVFDVGETEDGIPYMVMEVLEGESLADRLYRKGKLPVDRALQIGAEVLSALGAAHAKGIVHRDIKPHNIFLRKQSSGADHVLVLDFGIAKVMLSGAPSITETGAAVGTALYMAPEQATAQKDLDARADLWAVGVVLYEMLAGEAPFTAPTLSAVIAKIVTEDPPSLSLRNPEVTPELETVIRKALARNRADRYASARALANDLERAAIGLYATERRLRSTPPPGSGTPAISSPPVARTDNVAVTAKTRKTGPSIALLAAIGIGLVVALGAIALGRRANPTDGASAPVSPSSLPVRASAPLLPSGAASSAPEPPVPPPSSSAPVASVTATASAKLRPGPACGPREVLTEGHCCPKGLLWSKMAGRCDRPLATNL